MSDKYPLACGLRKSSCFCMGSGEIALSRLRGSLSGDKSQVVLF